MKKKEFLAHWNSITPGQQVTPSPVPYKHQGTTYAEDGIRLTGSREFIDSILSNLKSLLGYENGSTRLQVVYKQSTDRQTGLPLDSWNCYIQVHTRGAQAQMANAMVSAIAGRQVLVSAGY